MGEPDTAPPEDRIRLRVTVLKSTNDTLVSLMPKHEGIGLFLDSLAPLIAQLLKNVATAERHPSSKLNADQVRKIRASTEPLKCLAADHHMSIGQISLIRSRKYYRWVQ